MLISRTRSLSILAILAMIFVGCSDSSFSGSESNSEDEDDATPAEVEETADATPGETEDDPKDTPIDTENDAAGDELDNRRNTDTVTDLADVVACDKQTSISGWSQSGNNPNGARAKCKGVDKTTQYVFCNVDGDFISDCVEYKDDAKLPIPEDAVETTASLTANINAANHAQCLQIAAAVNSAMEADKDPVVGCFRLIKQ